jgi:aminopeptidase N
MPKQHCGIHCVAHRLQHEGLGWNQQVESGSGRAYNHPHTHGDGEVNDLEGFASVDAPIRYAPSIVLEPIHLDITIRFDFENASAQVEVTHTIKCNSAVPSHGSSSKAVNQANSTLMLHGTSLQHLQLAGCEPSTPDLPKLHYNGEKIIIQWQKPFAPSEIRKITLKYQVVQPVSGLFFAHPKYHVSNQGIYAITDHETECARYWLATIDEPTIRPHLTIRMIAPSSMVAVANGTLVKETIDGDKKTTVYDHDFPCPSYLTCIVVGDFVSIDDRPATLMNGTKLPIKYFAPKNIKPAELKRGLDSTPAMIEWIEKRLKVAIPWPKYFQICAPFIGGMYSKPGSAVSFQLNY